MRKTARIHSTLLPAAFTLLALVAGAPSFARADVPPPDVDACEGRQAGEACTIEGYLDQPDQTGVCVSTTCESTTPNRPDAGPRPDYACIRCEPAAHFADAGAMNPDDPSPPAPKADAGTSENPNNPKGDDDSHKDSSGCSVSGVGLARGFAPWFLAAGFALLVTRRRKS
jgi:MYXO-CTERM domain-containing protein